MSPESDRQLYERWVHEQTDGLYRLALRLTGETHVAEELVQETFFHAWRSMDSLRDKASARGWLFRILRHRYGHWLRGKRRKVSAISLDEPDDVVANVSTPSEAVEREEFLQHALDHLEDRYKLPLLMVYLDGMTCREAAAELNLPLGTVLSRIHRARHTLRRWLEASRRREAHPTLRLVAHDRPPDTKSSANPPDSNSTRQFGGGS